VDTESKSRLDKSLEKATGLKRVELANPSGSMKKETEPTAFVKPVYLQDPDYKDTKGAILVYNSNGKQLMQPFYNLVISGSQYAVSDRVSRTATMDGEKRIFLGSAPVRVAFSIGLLDYKNHPWKDQFMYLWNNVLRGTILQESDASVYIYCAGDIFVGDLHACQVSRASDNDGAIMASISMDCNRPPIPANTAFTGKEFTLESVVDYAVKEVINAGFRVSKSTWRPD
jgi:hypothetical protein